MISEVSTAIITIRGMICVFPENIDLSPESKVLNVPIQQAHNKQQTSQKDDTEQVCCNWFGLPVIN